MKTTSNYFTRAAFVFFVLAAALLTAAPAHAQTWATNSPLNVARWAHTATSLNDGTVLVAGGLIFNTNGNSADTNSVEIYDPVSGTSSTIAPMQRSRHSHRATLLPNGQVLISGGGGDASSETYDPGSQTWINNATMHDERIVHAAVLLPNGKVLAAGGFDDNHGVDLSSAELYDPNTATWSNTASMPYTADTLASALLTNGMVLVCGGSFNSGGVTNAVIYNPATGTWTNTTPMNEARSGHTATLLADGRVLVEGGTFDNTAEVYDPVAKTWTFVASMNDGRFYSDAVLLTNGQVMVMGDGNSDVEIYDPVGDTWTLTDPLPVPGNLQTATLVSGGAVVVTGGSVTEFNGPALAVVETFGGVTTTPSLAVTDSPTNGNAPLSVDFTSPGVDSLGNTVTDWNWDFGDGHTSTEQSPTHTYTTGGTFFPSLTAHSTFGSSPLSVTGLGSITVAAHMLAVTATPQSGVVPLTVQFASPGVDSLGSTVDSWNWDFGDGGTSTTQNPSHVYTNIGSYSPTLTAYATFSDQPLPITGLGGISVYTNPVPAFRILYTFSTPFGTGPNGGLAISASTLFGTTVHGGTNGYGNVFGINTDGTGFTDLFDSSISSGADPDAGLFFSAGTLYGTTYVGGSQGGGTVFAINTNGTGYTNVFSFTGNVPSTGTQPAAAVVLSGNTLYGTTQYGGGSSAGVVFAVPTNGGSITDLHSFSTPLGDFRMNYDGDGPLAGLCLSGGVLYGTAEAGGAAGTGTVFSVATNNPGSFNPIYAFSSTANAPGTNADGAFPFSRLVISGGTLYGTTFAGGSSGNGVVFAVGTNGTPFTNLYSFTGGNDGAGPKGGLTLVGSTLYGTTSAGGTSSNGTIFGIKMDGSNFKSLYSFTGGADGANPQADLLLSGNTLYGAAASGGSSGNGTVFSFTLPRTPLTITRAGTNVILTWSASAYGYTLQSSSHLGAAAAWNPVFPLPVNLGGLNTVTNGITNTSMFYRLSQ